MGLKDANNQVICSNCEEQVHPSAISCPYCNCNLKAPMATREKICDSLQEQFLQHTKKLQMENSVPRKEKEHVEKEVLEEPSSETAADVLIPLFTMLTGSCFLFFALFLKLFSKNGKLVFEWKGESAFHFFVPAVILLLIGFFSLSSSQIEKK